MSVALFVHHSKRMRLNILSSVALLVLPQFSNDLISGTIFEKKFIEYKLCALVVSTLILKQNWASYDKKMCVYIYIYIYICRHVKYPLFVSHFNKTWIFFDMSFKKNAQKSNFMKILPAEAWVVPCGQTGVRTGGGTDLCLFNSANVPKGCQILDHILNWRIQFLATF